jgi:hypothetical protein
MRCTRFTINPFAVTKQGIRQIKAEARVRQILKQNGYDGIPIIERRLAKRLGVSRVVFNPDDSLKEVARAYADLSFNLFGPSSIIRNNMKRYGSFETVFIGHGDGYGTQWLTKATIDGKEKIINPYELVKTLTSQTGKKCLMITCDDKYPSYTYCWKTGKSIVSGEKKYTIPSIMLKRLGALGWALSIAGPELFKIPCNLIGLAFPYKKGNLKLFLAMLNR